MSATHTVNVDLAKVYDREHPRSVITVLGWGDYVQVTGEPEDRRIPVRSFRYVETDNGSIIPEEAAGFIKIPAGQQTADVIIPLGESKVLKVNFVDVQQGDGCVIETPGGKVILVDGGDNQLFARYLAARFRGSSADRPKRIDAIVVTHGDADHFAGLSKIWDSERNRNPAKRLFIHPERIFHNGIFKRPSKDAAGHRRGDRELLNDTVVSEGRTFLQPLIDDPSTLADEDLNTPFRDWKEAINAWRERGAIEVARLEFGRDDTFDFVAEEGLKIEVLGPLTQDIAGSPALRFLGEPPKGPRIGHERSSTDDDAFRGHSASHTINGHSILLRMTYGGFSFLLTGDLNDQSERILTRSHNSGQLDLTAEVLKAPHHGSADFSPAFLKAVSPIISVISSGDESEQKEYIHPRATLIGALGRFSRVPEPLVFCTELVAFFKKIGWSVKDNNQGSADNAGEVRRDPNEPRFFGFKRTAYGIVKLRTDGKRLLVYTNSGKNDLKEAYAFARDDHGQPVPVAVRQA